MNRIYFAHSQAAHAASSVAALRWVPDPTWHPREYASKLAELGDDAAVTSNPYVLDCFAFGSVYVIGPSGRIARLLDHPGIESWRGVMTPGEFVSSVGEAWVDDLAATEHER